MLKWFCNRSEQCHDKARKDEKPECTFVHEDFESLSNAIMVLRITNDLLRILQLSQMASSYISRLQNHF
jgi:hypothetical protein